MFLPTHIKYRLRPYAKHLNKSKQNTISPTLRGALFNSYQLNAASLRQSLM